MRLVVPLRPFPFHVTSPLCVWSPSFFGAKHPLLSHAKPAMAAPAVFPDLLPCHATPFCIMPFKCHVSPCCVTLIFSCHAFHVVEPPCCVIPYWVVPHPFMLCQSLLCHATCFRIILSCRTKSCCVAPPPPPPAMWCQNLPYGANACNVAPTPSVVPHPFMSCLYVAPPPVWCHPLL